MTMSRIKSLFQKDSVIDSLNMWWLSVRCVATQILLVVVGCENDNWFYQKRDKREIFVSAFHRITQIFWSRVLENGCF